MLKRTVLALICLMFPALVFGSDIQIPQSALYPFRTTLEVQDDFLTGSTGNGVIGVLGWGTTGGTSSTIASIANRPGILRRDTSAVLGTVAALYLHAVTATVLDATNYTHSMLYAVRLNNNDANTTARVGAANTTNGNPPADGVYLEKLDADTNWFCVQRAAGAQTRTDTTVAVNTSFNNLGYTRNSSGIQFQINGVNVCGLQTANIPTVLIDPGLSIVTSAAAAKTIDIDYFQIRIFGLAR